VIIGRGSFPVFAGAAPSAGVVTGAVAGAGAGTGAGVEAAAGIGPDDEGVCDMDVINTKCECKTVKLNLKAFING